MDGRGESGGRRALRRIERELPDVGPWDPEEASIGPEMAGPARASSELPMPGPPAGDPPDHPGLFPHFDEPDAKDGLPGLPDGWEDAPEGTPGAAGSGDEDEGSGNDTADEREDDARDDDTNTDPESHSDATREEGAHAGRTVPVFVCGDVRDVDIEDPGYLWVAPRPRYNRHDDTYEERQLVVDAASGVKHLVHGDDKNGNGTFKDPFATAQTALKLAQPGSVIVLKPGAYRVYERALAGKSHVAWTELNSQGTQDKPVVITSQYKWQAVPVGSLATGAAANAAGNSGVIGAGFDPWYATAARKRRESQRVGNAGGIDGLADGEAPMPIQYGFTVADRARVAHTVICGIRFAGLTWGAHINPAQGNQVHDLIFRDLMIHDVAKPASGVAFPIRATGISCSDGSTVPCQEGDEVTWRGQIEGPLIFGGIFTGSFVNNIKRHRCVIGRMGSADLERYGDDKDRIPHSAGGAGWYSLSHGLYLYGRRITVEDCAFYDILQGDCIKLVGSTGWADPTTGKVLAGVGPTERTTVIRRCLFVPGGSVRRQGAIQIAGAQDPQRGWYDRVRTPKHGYVHPELVELAWSNPERARVKVMAPDGSETEALRVLYPPNNILIEECSFLDPTGPRWAFTHDPTQAYSDATAYGPALSPPVRLNYNGPWVKGTQIRRCKTTAPAFVSNQWARYFWVQWPDEKGNQQLQWWRVQVEKTWGFEWDSESAGKSYIPDPYYKTKDEKPVPDARPRYKIQPDSVRAQADPARNGTVFVDIIPKIPGVVAVWQCDALSF